MELTEKQIKEARAILNKAAYADISHLPEDLAKVLQYVSTTGALTDEEKLHLETSLHQYKGEWMSCSNVIREIESVLSRRTAEPHPVAKGPCSVCSDGGIDYCKIHGPTAEPTKMAAL